MTTNIAKDKDMSNESEDVNPQSDAINGIQVLTQSEFCPKNPHPGVYKGISFRQYLDINALNSGKVRKACESMLVYKRYLIEQETITPSYALEFGRAFAAMCQDPDALNTTIMPGATKTAFTKAWVEEMEANPDLIYVKESEIPMLKAMIKSFRSHPYTKQYSYDAYNELTVLWHCKYTKQFCKARIDIFKDAHCIDIKTTANVRPHKFKWQIIDFRYDIQVCFYADGLRANGIRCNWCSNFFIEKEEILPDVVPKGYNDEQMDACREEYIKAIGNILEAKETGFYPGYAVAPLVDLCGFDEPTESYE